MSIWWPFRRPKPEKRAECRDGYCEAWAWDACTGGRCKYHCDLYCKCVPVGAPGTLKVVRGGRGAP